MFLRFYHSSQTRLAVYGLGLTQIAQISQAFFVGGKSHGGWGVENLTDALLLCFQRLTQIQRDSTKIIRGLNGLFLNNFAYLCLYTFKKAFVS